MSGYLPKAPESSPVPTFSTESTRIGSDEILSLVQLSGEEMGRTSAVRSLYIKSMGEKFASVTFLDRAREITGIVTEIQEHGLDIDSQDEEVKQAMIDDIHNLNALSERAWGTVKAERLSSMIARIRRQANSTLANQDVSDIQRSAANDLLEKLPQVDDEMADQHNFSPSMKLLQTYEPLIRKKYKDFFDLVPDQERLNRDELKTLFEQSIHCMAENWQLDNARGWKVELGKGNINVDIETKTVWIPEKHAGVTRVRAEELVMHEIGGHLLRNLQGEKTGDSFMATHMAGRSEDEEGLLSTLQCTLTGKSREAGVNYYLAIGLGKDVLKTGSFADNDKLAEIIAAKEIMNGISAEKAASSAKQQVHRVTRGMPSVIIDGKQHRAFWTNDLKYAIGQEHAVRWLEENIGNPRALDEVMAGKFAYSDPQQSAYARQLYYEKIEGTFAVPTAAN